MLVAIEQNTLTIQYALMSGTNLYVFVIVYLDGFVFLYEMHITYNGTMLEYIYIAGRQKVWSKCTATDLEVGGGGRGQAATNTVE